MNAAKSSIHRKSSEQQAWEIAVELNKLGIKPVAQGNWVVLKPPPPLDLMMRITELPEGLVERLLPQVISSSQDAAAIRKG